MVHADGDPVTTEPTVKPLTEHMVKLYRIANGALDAIERKAQEHPRVTPPVPKEWWDGYRQGLDDVCHFARQKGLL